MNDVGGDHEPERFRSTYQGLGAFDSPSDEPSAGRTRRRTGIIVAVVVALLAAGGITYALTSGGDPQAEGPGPSPTTSAGPTTTTGPTTTGPTTTTSERPEKVEPVFPGWLPVVSKEAGAVYDVPDSWRVESPDYVTGFQGDGDTLKVSIHGVSTYKPEACPEAKGSIRGRAGFADAGSGDLRTVAETAAEQWIEAATGQDGDEATVSEPEEVELATEGTVTMVTADADAPDGECSAPRVRVTTAAFESAGQTVLFVMYQDQDVDDALPDDVAKTIVGSLRPYPSEPSG